MAAEPLPSTRARVLRGHSGAVNAVRFNGAFWSSAWSFARPGFAVRWHSRALCSFVRSSQGLVCDDVRPGPDRAALESASRRPRGAGRRAAGQDVRGPPRLRRAGRRHVRTRRRSVPSSVEPLVTNRVRSGGSRNALYCMDSGSANDNAQFASCGRDKAVFLWDVPTAKVIRKFEGHEHVRMADARGWIRTGGAIIKRVQ